MGILSLKLLIFSPLVMAIIFLLPIFSGHGILVRRIAKSFAGCHFLYTLLFLAFFDSSLKSNYDSSITIFGQDWLQSLGISLTFGLDSLSLYLVILTSFLILMACIASKGIIRSKHCLYYALIFLVQFSVLGVFCAQDMFEFFMFWEIELIPMYFLISLWGNKDAKKSAMKFLLYTFLGSMFMLCGFLMLYNFNFISTSQLSASLNNLNFDFDTAPMYLQILTSVLILFGFAVKLPIIPFHTWLPNAHVDAPAPVSMLLAGLLLKMGAYGIIRFNIQILPDAFLFIIPYLVALALINIIFSAIVAYCQSDIKKIVAYSSISSMGIVLLGLCSVNVLGLSGAIFLMLAHGVISAGLFYVVGILYHRTSTREILQYNGIASVMPRLAGFTLLLVLAGIGVPGLMAFNGEFLIFFGAFCSTILNNYYIQVIAIISILVLVLSACYSLKLMHNVFYAEVSERWEKLNDIAFHEFFVLFTLAFVVLLFGLMPQTILDNLQTFVTSVIGAFGG